MEGAPMRYAVSRTPRPSALVSAAVVFLFVTALYLSVAARPAAAQSSPCGTPAAVFGLGSSGNYTILGLSNGSTTISEGLTVVTGDVGVGANNGGSLLKATIPGKLWLQPTGPPGTPFHPPLTRRGHP